MEWTHPLLTGLAMGHDEVVESHLERGWVHYEDYNHRFGYRKVGVPRCCGQQQYKYRTAKSF